MNAATLLKKRPESGEVHRWICYAACRLVDAGCEDNEVEEIVEEALQEEGLRDAKPNEIDDAIAFARGERKTSTPKRPPPNPALIASLSGPTLDEIINVDLAGTSRAFEHIDALFPGNPLLCVGKTDFNFTTNTKQNLRGVLGLRSLVVPSPMSARVGRTKQGKISMHSLDNTGGRKYHIVEFDADTLDSHIARLWHLKQYAPLKLIVFSGNKGLHGWFHVEGWPEEKLERWFNYTAALGADKATETRSQFVRIPDGTRQDGKESGLLKQYGARDPRRQHVIWIPQ